MSKYPFKSDGGKKKPTPKTEQGKAQRTALSYDQIHGKNQYEETLHQTKLTKAYSVAEQKLKKKTYAEQKYKTKENIIKVRSFYPYLSVFLSLSVGILTGDLFASGLSESAYYITLAILTVAVFLVAWLLEDLKRDACRDYFAKDKPSGKQRFWLNSLFMYSVIISGIGGYVASVHLNDRTAEIEQNYQIQSDSVNMGYGEQIELLNSIIDENKKRMQSSSKWTRYHAQKDLAEAQGTKTELLKLQNSMLSEIKTEKKAELTAGDLMNQYKAYVIVLVVLLLESLYIRSFAYEYAVEHQIKAENRNHGFVTPPEDVLPTAEPLTLQEVAMQMLLENLTNQNGMQGINPAVQTRFRNASYSYPQSTGNVGFQFNNEEENSETSQKQPTENPSKNVQFNENVNQVVPEQKPQKPHIEEEKEQKRVKPCVNCGKDFEYKHWLAKYCGDACRKDAWQKRTGKPLSKYPKKKK